MRSCHPTPYIHTRTPIAGRTPPRVPEHPKPSAADYPIALPPYRQTTCYCSNQYPAALHGVDDTFCDNPCSPDQTRCFVYSCCGSKDGKFFTVSQTRNATVSEILAFDHSFFCCATRQA
jgi:hypothetical protein